MEEKKISDEMIDSLVTILKSSINENPASNMNAMEVETETGEPYIILVAYGDATKPVRAFLDQVHALMRPGGHEGKERVN